MNENIIVLTEDPFQSFRNERVSLLKKTGIVSLFFLIMFCHVGFLARDDLNLTNQRYCKTSAKGVRKEKNRIKACNYCKYQLLCIPRMLSNADMHAMELFKTFYWLSSYPVLMNKGVSF